MAGLLLEARGISKHFGGVAALRGAHFGLKRGEVHALVGGNGAGKSTLAKILAGSVRPDSGQMLIEGQPVAIRNPNDAQRLGIGIIYQELDLFPHLSVTENMVIGNLRYAESKIVDFQDMEAFCRPFLDQVGLDCLPRRPAGSLPIAGRQLLAIARTLSMDARAILMDEPTSSLPGESVERLFALIAKMKARGVSIVYVSHKMDEIFRISDRATVLRDGQTVATVETAASDPAEIIRLMLERTLSMAARPYRRPRGEVVLEARNLTTKKLRDVSFQLHRSEVLAIAGLVGSGRSEVGAALFGLDRIAAGSVYLHGRPCDPASPRNAIRRGIGLVPEDRCLEGLMMRMSVIENSTLGILRRMRKRGLLNRGRELSALVPAAERLALRYASPAAPAGALSGGNQQKVLLARWLLLDPEILFLDDPTRGIDVAAKQDIYRIIDELASAGKSLILVSSELPELLRLADRILVLAGGCVSAVFDAAAFDATDAAQEAILAAATGSAASRGDS